MLPSSRKFFEMLAGAFTILTIISSIDTQPIEPDKQIDSCNLPLDRGDSKCDVPASGLRYYYDTEMDDCYEYFYEGCAGGRNTFNDYNSCHTTCIPVDKQKCGGNANIIKICTKESDKCPDGSKCIFGRTEGICCDIKNEEEWEKESHPKCKSGKLLLKKEWYGETTQLGKNCSHKFCPEDYKCIQTKRLAHCCSETEK